MELATAVTTQPGVSEISENGQVIAIAEPSSPAPQPAPIAPVTTGDRLVALDTLRGVAVLGILLMNILFFGMPMVTGFNPDLGGPSTFLNRATWAINQILFEGKMRTIFSMCFGAGVILLTSRAEKRGGQATIADIYYRRLLWLILFGLLHAYFLWAGDILYAYGIVGLFLFPFRKLRPWALITIGVFLLVLTLPMGVVKAVMIPTLREKAAQAEAAKKAGETLTDEQKAILQGWEQARAFRGIL